MNVSKSYVVMLNEKIRKAILEYYYDYWQKNPTGQISCEHLAEELGISAEQLRSNLLFLIDEGFIVGKPPVKYPERTTYRISTKGVKAVEHPEDFQDVRFLNLFLGDVGTVMQAQEIRIENGFYNAFKLAEKLNNLEVLRAVEEIEHETRKRNPDWRKIKDLLVRVRAEEKVFNVLTSVLVEVFKKWVG